MKTGQRFPTAISNRLPPNARARNLPLPTQGPSRKSSHGAEREAESPFVMTSLTVVATCRQQGRNVLEFLTDCFRAQQSGRPLPSLLPQPEFLINAA